SDGLFKLKDKSLENEIASFREKIIAVNQDIHGIYNKDDYGTIQYRNFGKLLMQFKKHLRPMFNKRFGRQFGKTVYN
ncbi:hypothetical protein, partial [Pantoea agglomerans]|uniref:hypothetical protein n=1 Tax=Enterobacter agglomerans TaxID=549 RepID=UPI002B1CE3D2